MRHFPRVIAMLLAVASFAAGAGQVFRWVEPDGTVQYSERPPPGVGAEPVPLHYPPANRGQAEDELKRLRERAGLGAAGGPPASPPTAAPATPDQERQRAENCRIARENLRVLETSPRVSARDSEGNPVYLDDVQKQARLEETRRQVEQYCSPSR